MRRVLQFAFFLFTLVSVLGAGTAVVYEAALLAFGVVVPAQALALALGMGFLSASFIVATILGNWFYNFFTRAYYLITAVWMGALLYLFFASLIYAALVAVSPLFIAFGPWLFAAALLVSIYGIVHARRIIVTKVSVDLPNLPAAWRGRRAVWISDLHLGQIHGARFAGRVAAKVQSLAPDIIFIGGDLYDGTGAPDIPELTAPLVALKAPLGVYFITGNHEEYGDRERFLRAVRGAGMRTLVDEMVVVDGLQVVGVDYQNASDEARFAQILAKLAPDKNQPSILLKHEPRHLSVAEAAGVSLQISGHTHKAQQWPLVYFAQNAYHGFAYGLKKFQNMQVYTSSGVGTWGPPLRVGTHGEVVAVTFV